MKIKIVGLTTGDTNCYIFKSKEFINEIKNYELGSFLLPSEWEIENLENNVFFRSDSRDPDDIFNNGFKARNFGKNPKFSQPVYRASQQDIDHYSAVCLAVHPGAAALFPIKLPNQVAPKRSVWLYVCCPKSLYFTCDIQDKVSKTMTVRRRYRLKAACNVYAGEVCCMELSNDRVLAAFRIKRSWSGGDYYSGGSWRIVEKKWNRQFTSSLSYLKSEINYKFPLSAYNSLATPDKTLIEELEKLDVKKFNYKD
ncbi:MAG TPA: hypothetical protein VL995_15115 [Cellvibrio sp.]|nr:hypothetical protein [Cellvibrio sp.]